MKVLKGWIQGVGVGVGALIWVRSPADGPLS